MKLVFMWIVGWYAFIGINCMQQAECADVSEGRKAL